MGYGMTNAGGGGGLTPEQELKLKKLIYVNNRVYNFNFTNNSYYGGFYFRCYRTVNSVSSTDLRWELCDLVGGRYTSQTSTSAFLSYFTFEVDGVNSFTDDKANYVRSLPSTYSTNVLACKKLYIKPVRPYSLVIINNSFKFTPASSTTVANFDNFYSKGISQYGSVGEARNGSTAGGVVDSMYMSGGYYYPQIRILYPDNYSQLVIGALQAKSGYTATYEIDCVFLLPIMSQFYIGDDFYALRNINLASYGF